MNWPLIPGKSGKTATKKVRNTIGEDIVVKDIHPKLLHTL